MADLTIYELSDDTLLKLPRRAQQHGRSMNAETVSIIEDLLLRDAMGRQFGMTDEFDRLRARPEQGPPGVI